MKNRRKFILGGAAALAGAGGLIANHQSNSGLRNVVQPLSGLDKTSGTRPLHILLILTDQERFDLPKGLSLPGHEKMKKMATEFTQFYVNTTPCSPSRSNIYFGQHNQHTKMIANLGVYPQPQIPSDMASLGNYLRAQGYYTAYKGKWHLSDIIGNYELQYGAYPNSQHALEPFGFSDFNFDGDPHGSTWTGFKNDAAIASGASDWILHKGKEIGQEQPWFMAVNFVNPHDVMYYSSSDHQVNTRGSPYYLSPLAQPPSEVPYDEQLKFPLPMSFYKADLSTKPKAHQSYKDFCNIAYGEISASEKAWQDYQSYYFNCIRDADRHLLTVLNALEKSGQADKTIVIFTADHGEMAGAHGLRQKGPFIYQENMRVPFIVKHPAIKETKQTKSLASAVDIIPTILELSGVSPKKIMELYPQLAGVSFAQAIENSKNKTMRDERGILLNYDVALYMDPEFVAKSIKNNVRGDEFMPLRSLFSFGQLIPSTHEYAFFRGIHTGRYKFARYFKPAEHHVPKTWEKLINHNQLELYDLENDPHELNNLAMHPEDYKTLIMQLNLQLNALIALEIGEDLGDELIGPRFMKTL